MKKTAHHLKNFAFWVVGSFLYSTAIDSFCVPNNLILGGVSGISTLINHLFPVLPIGVMMIVLNIPMFILGYVKLGKEFIFSTIITTIISSLFIDIFQGILPTYTADKLLAVFSAGVLSGAGLALIFIGGATTGGIDIPAKVLTKKFRHLSMGRFILLIDGIIILATYFTYRSFESAIYSAVIIFISTKVIDSVMFGISNGKAVFIVTNKATEICSQIHKNLRRGVTIIPVKGAYTNEAKSMLFCSMRRGEISKMYSIVKQTDETAFITVADAREIIGEGFKTIDE